MQKMDWMGFCEGLGVGIVVTLIVKLICMKKKKRPSKVIKRVLRIAEGAVCVIGNMMGF